MVVQSMTYAEVYAEIIKDLESVFRWYKHQMKLIERIARKAQKFPCSHFLEYLSPRKNRWLMCTRIFRRQIHGGGAGVEPFLIQKYERGFALHAAVLDKNLDGYVITMHPHMFDRYAERMKIGKTGIDLIKHFIVRNVQSENDFTPELSGKRSQGTDNDVVHMCMEEGVLMGEVVAPAHVLIRTFITYDMAAGRQKEVFEDFKSRHTKDVGKRYKEKWFGNKQPYVKTELEKLKELYEHGDIE